MNSNKSSKKSDTTRRNFLKLSTGVIAGIAANFSKNSSATIGIKETFGSQKSAHQSELSSEKLKVRRRPNILILMTDHAKNDLLNPESKCITPNLDLLMSEGIQFSRCYTPTGMCSPARASLMTGTYPSTHGVWDCTHTQRKEWVDVSPKLEHWAQRLSENGYRTGYFGKWHTTQSKKLEKYGWQEYEIEKSTTMHGECIPGSIVASRKDGYKDYILAGVRRVQTTDPHHPAYEMGIDFIRRHAAESEPFCCFVSTSEPGDCMPPKRFMDMYDVESTDVSPTLHDDLKGKSDIQRRMQTVWKDLSEEDWKKITTCYKAEFTFLDSEMGRILNVLRDTGCYENTIILFFADHGQMLGAHGLSGLGLGLAYEEVYNIPLIIRLPVWLIGNEQHDKGKNIDDALVSLIDVGSTILDFCGTEPLPQAQGRSLRSLMEGSADKKKWQLAYGEFFGQRFMYSQRIVWLEDWKYIFSPGGVDELYYLADDPHEETNLAAEPKNREILLDMVERMWQKMAQIGDASLLNTDYATLRTAPIGPGEIRH